MSDRPPQSSAPEPDPQPAQPPASTGGWGYPETTPPAAPVPPEGPAGAAPQAANPYAAAAPGPANPYAAAPGGYGGAPAPQPSAAIAVLPHALGFLAPILFVPFLSTLLTGLAMIIAAGVQRRNPLAEPLSRSAGNWGITLMIASALLGTMHFVLLATLSDGSGSSFFPIGIPIVIYAAVCIAHLVVTIVGLVRAGQRRPWRNPLAIPFLSAPASR
jgi:uncharacterized Tic20 family protein